MLPILDTVDINESSNIAIVHMKNPNISLFDLNIPDNYTIFVIYECGLRYNISVSINLDGMNIKRLCFVYQKDSIFNRQSKTLTTNSDNDLTNLYRDCRIHISSPDASIISNFYISDVIAPHYMSIYFYSTFFYRDGVKVSSLSDGNNYFKNEYITLYDDFGNGIHLQSNIKKVNECLKKIVCYL